MLIHSIISEFDIFYLPEHYMQKGNDTPEAASAPNVVPCITDPAVYLKAGITSYIPPTNQ
jgi:hypothetical protein